MCDSKIRFHQPHTKKSAKEKVPINTAMMEKVSCHDKIPVDKRLGKRINIPITKSKPYPIPVIHETTFNDAWPHPASAFVAEH